MNFDELLKKYKLLLKEYNRLKEECNSLKAQLGISNPEPSRNDFTKTAEDCTVQIRESTDSGEFPNVNNSSDSVSKIKLYMSLFKGREDVYARRWENKKKGTSGYTPVCLNQWKPSLCGMPKTHCSKCSNRSLAPLDEQVIEDHLRGNMVAGIYPMLPDETCSFLAMDFDEANWQHDVSTVRNTCLDLNIPVAVERSRSGAGGHVWFFFEDPISAALARKFGTAILTFSMNKRHDMHFKSYDRLFPSQDTLPKGGFGNLIALPFQKAARKNGNSEFVDERFEPYYDQWAYLASIRRISEDHIQGFIPELCHGHELGVLKIDDEDPQETWIPDAPFLQQDDFPESIRVLKSNMLFIPKTGISQKALNRLKRLASFKNPMFFKHQAMRLSTYAHPRVISCADETTEYLCLPRGCEPDLLAELEQLGITAHLVDKTNAGKSIDVAFNGHLTDEQVVALEKLLNYDIGILSGTTAFGKTIVAIRLIAERKVNTLVLVDKVGLVSQWKDKLLNFLIVNETLPEIDISTSKKRGRKKGTCVIGQLGAGKNTLSGIVDIAVMQTLSRQGEVKDCVKNYGMVIADECHHASAFTYENILKTTDARFVYGLTATPTRKDGHHPILFMQCGPIRYRDSAKEQAKKRPFDHFIIPRFTSLRMPLDRDEKDVSIQELYSEIVENDFRNQQIIEDVISNYKSGRNCIVLSSRTSHVRLLAKKLMETVPDVMTLIGGMGAKKTREVFQQIADIPEDKNLVLVATGSFIGEGFDAPRLDTLFLAMPISWKGTLQQYAGRLHRLFENKKEVRIYDYVDIHVKMLERMYQKRVSGYASMGYKARGEDMGSASFDIIFDKNNFLSVFSNDIGGAKKEIIIVSPFVRKRRTFEMMRHLEDAFSNNVRVIVVTRPVEDFKMHDRVTLQEIVDQLQNKGIRLVFRSNIHQKFAIMDQKLVWYGSINLLSYGSAQESIMRIDSPNIAYELIKSIERLQKMESI